MTDRIDWISARSDGVHGTISVPGDKSISHRALMLAALADGDAQIDGFLEGEDTCATAAILSAMGVRIETPTPAQRIVHGVGLHGLQAPTISLDCGNSGTGMRLLAGLLAGQGFASVLCGDSSLSKRPMHRVTDPLRLMGADIETRPGGVPPLTIRAAVQLRGIRYTPPVASAQVKSAVLLAGLYAEGVTEVREIHPTRDYTERMLEAFGWPSEFGPGWARLSGRHHLRATNVQVPADFSSAAFFIVAACIVPGSELILHGVGMNPRRSGLLHVLRLMGALITEHNARQHGGEPVADIHVSYTAALQGVEVPVEHVADMIDEFPALFIAAANARGITRIHGAAELRVKESDRIAAMANGLRALGVLVEETPDGAFIHGGSVNGGSVDAQGDHRIAMSFAIAGLVSSQPVRINDCANVATSFPDFLALANACGFRLTAL